MSREIKFRAWLKDEKVMVDVEQVDFYNNTIAYIFDNYAEVEQEWLDNDIQNVELLQYTGIKDTIGNEIYESYFVEDEHGRTNLVMFKDGLLLIGNWNAHGFMNAFTEFKVVGNIYENPELLEVNND